jgi:hypothetical protein
MTSKPLMTALPIVTDEFSHATNGVSRLKPWKIREWQLPAMDMHPPEFRAAMEHGEHLSGI